MNERSLARSASRSSVPERLRSLAGQPPLPLASARNAAEVSRLSATDRLRLRAADNEAVGIVRADGGG